MLELVVSAVVIVLALAGVVVLVVMVGRQSEERRGGVLELDTPGARRALADADDWLEPYERLRRDPDVKAAVAPLVAAAELLEHGARPAYVQGVSPLRRCRPSQRLHYHGGVSSVHSAPGLSLHPFADRGDAA